MTVPQQAMPALLGVPYDEGAYRRRGSKHGPDAIRRELYHLRTFSQSARKALAWPLEDLDRGDISFPPFPYQNGVATIEEAVQDILGNGRAPVLLGGDHSITFPVLRALAAAHGKQSFGILHFDAHSDTGGPAGGFQYHHGAPFRNAIEEGLVEPSAIFQFGLRGLIPPDGMDYARDKGVHCILMDDFATHGCRLDAYPIDPARRYYVSIDIDAIDPAFAPGTGTPVPGGFTSREMLSLIRQLAAFRLVGADLVEVAPEYEVGNQTAILAANLVLELLIQATFVRPDTPLPPA